MEFSCWPINTSLHCKENTIYVFRGKELRGLSPNFHIHVSVSDLYIHRIGPQIFLQHNRPIDCGNIKMAHRVERWKLGLRPRYSFSGNICFELSVLCLCCVRFVRILNGMILFLVGETRSMAPPMLSWTSSSFLNCSIRFMESLAWAAAWDTWRSAPAQTIVIN